MWLKKVALSCGGQKRPSRNAQPRRLVPSLPYHRHEELSLPFLLRRDLPSCAFQYDERVLTLLMLNESSFTVVELNCLYTYLHTSPKL